MPTGYTADLEKKKYDVKRWLSECVIRAMGVCVTLRDSDNMSAEEIARQLEKEAGDSYHAGKLKAAQAALDSFKKLSDAELKARFEAERKTAQRDYAARLKEHSEKSKAHLKSTAETKALYEKAVRENRGEVIVNTLKFALEQLNQAYSFDYGSGPYRDDILGQSLDGWKQSVRKKILWDIEYHSKELAKEETRTFNRAHEYKAFVAFVNEEAK